MSELSMPAYPSGSVQQTLVRQYSYLFQMAQQLNRTLSQMEQHVDAAEISTAATRQGAQQQYDKLKSLVIKTADIVSKELDTMTAELKGKYVAVSDFGTYMEQLNAYLEANPDAVTQYYGFAAALQADTDEVGAAFRDYKISTEGYIRTGAVYFENGVPIYGVAVGQDLTTTEIDGVEVVDQNNFRATFTAQKLSFWQDETEIAYVSNNRLYITNITVLEAVDLGKWRVTTDKGLAFQWIGT